MLLPRALDQPHLRPWRLPCLHPWTSPPGSALWWPRQAARLPQMMRRRWPLRLHRCVVRWEPHENGCSGWKERGRGKPWHEALIDCLWLTHHTHALLTHKTSPPLPPGRCSGSHARRRHGGGSSRVHVTHGWRAVCCSLCGCTGGWWSLLCSLLRHPRGTGNLSGTLL